MPTSDSANIPPILYELARLSPRTILDLGIGFGKYGALAREYLDINAGRIDPSSWEIRIDGVEGFEKYRNVIHDHLYSKVRYENFADPTNWEKYDGYDLVMMIDSLEHIEKNLGSRLLETLRRQNRYVLVSCPGGDYPQGAVNNNEYECHRSFWPDHEMAHLGGIPVFHGFCNVRLFPSLMPVG